MSSEQQQTQEQIFRQLQLRLEEVEQENKLLKGTYTVRKTSEIQADITKYQRQKER